MEVGMSEKIEKWADNLNIFDDKMDQYAYLIDLAKQPTTLPEELRSNDRLVEGCISQIWVDVGSVDDKTKIYYDSDAMITKGITHIVCDCFNDLPISEAKQIQKSDFQELGLDIILSANRRNGLAGLIDTLQTKIAKL